MHPKQLHQDPVPKEELVGRMSCAGYVDEAYRD